MDCQGEANEIAGIIRDFRQEVVRALREECDIQCGTQDVIQGGGAGYRFREWIAVRSGDAATGTDAASGHRPVDGTDHVPDCGTDGTDNGGDDTDDPATNRCRWIVKELSKGRILRAPDITSELNVSSRTVKRDLDALRNANWIEFVGPARTGHCRVKTPTGLALGSTPFAVASR